MFLKENFVDRDIVLKNLIEILALYDFAFHTFLLEHLQLQHFPGRQRMIFIMLKM